ncbi:MAG: type I glutamate--ammonia ligase [bacterium]
MFKNIDELQRCIKDEKIEFLDFKVCDFQGRWRHMTHSTAGMDTTRLTRGSGISLSPYPGYRMIQQGDMLVRPDPATAFLNPFAARKTISMICDIFHPDGRPYERNPRNIVRKAERQIKRLGIDGASRWLPEFEFYIFDGARYGSGANQAYYKIDSKYGSWNHGDCCDTGPFVGARLPDTGVGQCDAPRDRHANLRSEMVRRIENAGYPVKYHHHELGGAGQCEIELKFDSILRTADSVLAVKYIIHNTAIEFSHSATFMPKPMHGAPGSGLHFHQFIEKDGKSLFYGGPKKYACLSTSALHYIGGLLKHTPALTALCSPSANSFRRFGVGMAAPMNLFFSESNRTATIRIPGYDKTPERTRIEYRIPDATCNPYFAVAAQLMAGLDGIRSKIDPKKEGFGPFDFNNYELSEKERAKFKSGPTTLGHALAELEKDHAFLTTGRVFPKEVIETWIKLKKAELDDRKRRPHPYDFELYYDF